MKLNNLINNLPSFFYRAKNDKNWTAEFVSQGFYQLTGYSVENVTSGKSHFAEIILEADRDMVWKTIQKALKNQETFHIEYRITHKNGIIKHFWEQGQAVYDANNTLIAIEGFVQDITKQKETELQLREEKAKNTDLLEAIPDMMFIQDLEGNYTDSFAPAPDKLFMSAKEFIGKNMKDVLPSHVFKVVSKAHKDAISSGELQVVEYSVKNKEDFFEARVIHLNKHGVLTIVRYITEKKNTERKLIENEERYRLAIKAGEFSAWDWNLQTNNVIRDDYSMFGPEFEKQESTFDSFLAIVHPDDKEDLKLAISIALKLDKPLTKEYRIVLPNKSIRWLRVKGRAFKNSNGKPERLIGVTNNITAHKEAAKKIKESDEKLLNYAIELENKVKERTSELQDIVQKLTQTNLHLEDQIQETKVAESKATESKFLLNNISQKFPKGFVVVFDSNFKIVLVEGEEVEDLGFKGLADAQTLIDNVKGVPKDIIEKAKRKILKTFKGQHCTFEVAYQNRIYRVNSTPLLNEKNEIKQVLLVHNNITLQKKAELEIINTLKKEQELSELKSRFISMASHEFRTPLSAILSSAILIEKLNVPGKEERRLNHVSKIRSNVKNLVTILNDFLSLSKLEEGKVIAQPESFDIIDFSKSVLEECEGIKKDGQQITLQSDLLEINVFLDIKLIRHILFNLLSNAIKYSEENKTITLAIALKNQMLHIDITDQGIGIPLEDQNNMFQRFYRANNTANIQGTGLGLNIVKQYTELMEGNISFKSKVSVGSTFYVALPLNTRKDEKSIIN
ncbi:PAS domain-containing protein [Bizionia gelidisalsuginis]|uniref:histidine kinase n=1 Tax=Bizionia gelidisalsuginis TaxID=291188 RepID=A0ABY3M8K4_9FLAO|nr:PAS domain-containing protein [Bizionia gelidisalsuginis]TYC10555.1 PAS domain-containing protein [Bizionia gelidisalsuginis]